MLQLHLTHPLQEKGLFSSFQYQWSTPAMWKESSLSVQMGHDCALCESTVCTTEGRNRWPKRSFSSLTSAGVHTIRNCILTTRCRILCGNCKLLPLKVFLNFFLAVKDRENTLSFVITDKTQKGLITLGIPKNIANMEQQVGRRESLQLHHTVSWWILLPELQVSALALITTLRYPMR